DMRRTFATRILQKGADIETVRSLLGHYSISVTQRYVHSNEEKRREAVELLKKGDELLRPGDMKQNEEEDRGVTCLFSVN
ncbi:tyrosine-type recombinase/integrase, partial [bacterium]|nr:tyrosine-type recombinase/integrase [bacterium]